MAVRADARADRQGPVAQHDPAPAGAAEAPASGRLDAAGVLALQRSVGNAATARILASAAGAGGKIQRAPSPVLQSLAVNGANAVAGSTDHFVIARGGGPVTVDATVDDPTKATARNVTWSAGSPGANALQRRVATGRLGTFPIRARAGGVSQTVTIHVPATAPPAANPAAALTHTKIGTSNPGTDFGLTVVTIGTQGVKRPTFVIDTHIDGTNWAFRVRSIRHGFKVGVRSQGRTNVSGPGDPNVRPSTIGPITTDLTPPAAGAANGPPRTRFWSQRITTAHEQAHVDRFYSAAFWEAAMVRFETTVETTTPGFNHASAGARSASGVLKANKAAFETAVTTEHNAADAAEIGGSEVAAHGVSNPMYTALLAAIRDSVVPPNPTAFTATPGAGGSVVVNWTFTTANETGFVVERRVGRSAFATAGTTGVAGRTFTDAGLAPGTRVTYRVRAQGVKGNSAPSNARTVTTTP